MSEQDYINVKELAIVMSAKRVLSDITPQISDVIPIGQFEDIMKTLSHWEGKLFDKINLINP